MSTPAATVESVLRPSPGSRAETPGPSAAPEAREERPVPPAPAASAPAPDGMPLWRTLVYVLGATILGLAQGLGNNLISANIPQLQGAFGATTAEVMWLVAAYMAPNVSLTLLLIKIRTQFGLRRFAEISIPIFLLVSTLHLAVDELSSAIIVRFIAGAAAAPMSTLCFLYMLEPFPPARKLSVALPLVMVVLGLGMPVARLVSPTLLDHGWHGLYLIEVAMALLSFAVVYLLPLTPVPREKVIQPMDIVSYLMIALGFGLTAIVLCFGRIKWWTEAPWLGVSLAVAAAALTVAVAIELNRKTPLVDFRWLVSREMLVFTGALLVFRIALSEQTSGAFYFFQALGLLNEQMSTLLWIVTGATIAAGLACALVLKPGREPAIHMVALMLLAAGALMDAQATNLTRPAQMYVSQALIAAASALFMPAALHLGLMTTLKRGRHYILSFVIVFLTTQSIGGLLGSSLLGSFVVLRQNVHLNELIGHLALSDPVAAQRVNALSGAYAQVITDPALRQAEGLRLLSTQATREACVLAYNDLFLLVACVATLALVALIIHVAVRAARQRMTPEPATA
jgi:MFS family permease